MNQRPKWLSVEQAFRQVRAKANINAIIKPFSESELPIKSQFKKKLAERIEQPRIESSRLNGMKDRYKIKLRNAA